MQCKAAEHDAQAQSKKAQREADEAAALAAAYTQSEAAAARRSAAVPRAAFAATAGAAAAVDGGGRRWQAMAKTSAEEEQAAWGSMGVARGLSRRGSISARAARDSTYDFVRSAGPTSYRGGVSRQSQAEMAAFARADAARVCYAM